MTAASWNWPASAQATKVRTPSRSTSPNCAGSTAGCGAPCAGSCLIGPRARPCFDRRAQRQVVRSGGARLGRQAVARPAIPMVVGGVRRQRLRLRLGFGAFPLIAVLVLHASAGQVSALSASAPRRRADRLAAGPWVEFHRKRPVMIAMDLTRFAVMMTISAGVRPRLSQLRPAAGRLRRCRRRRRSRSAPLAARTSRRSSARLICLSPMRGSSPPPGAPRQSGRRLAERPSALFGPVTTVWPMRSATCSRRSALTAIERQEQRPQRTVDRRTGQRTARTAGGTS